jgi:hypothetical protein
LQGVLLRFKKYSFMIRGEARLSMSARMWHMNAVATYAVVLYCRVEMPSAQTLIVGM